VTIRPSPSAAAAGYRRLHLPRLVLGVALALALAACSGDGPAVPPSATKGIIEGSASVGAAPLAVPSTDTPTGEALEPVSGPHWFAGVVEDDDVVPGEVIVGFAPGVRRSAVTKLQVGGTRLEQVREVAQAGVALFRSEGLDEAATRALAAALSTRSDVRYAVPNYLMQPQRVPNDPLYPFQWHYPAINLPAAWDITTGSPSTVVAVVDTGILHSFVNPTWTHPDLVDKVVPGYDFISDPAMAGDGDGRDPDPYEIPFDLLGPPPESSYHGTHVAGTIAARTNDGVGLAGVDWEAKILPIRVLGRGGGTMLDIMEGTLWAAGHPVPGVPANANPAHVINMSLSGRRTCTPFEQDAFDWIAAHAPNRAVVVVAAGNFAQDASAFAPAGCRNVITVGATDARGHLAPYSNLGPRIDVMAPGGDMTADRFIAGRPDGVLSITFNDGTGLFDAKYENGTSMAAPHVAGVVSLMKAIDPSITLEDALTVLRATARPLTVAQCGGFSSTACGAGLIDAAAALALVDGGTIPRPGAGGVSIEPDRIDLGTTSDAGTLRLRNAAPNPVAWSVTGYVEASTNPAPLPADATVFVDPVVSGSVAPGGVQSLTVRIDRARLSLRGTYVIGLVFSFDGSEVVLPVRVTIGEAASASPPGPMIVAAFLEASDGDLIESGFDLRPSFFSTFSFEAEAGANIVAAWVDVNDNGVVDAGDAFGIFPAYVAVEPGRVSAGVDIVLEQIVSIERSDAEADDARRARIVEVLQDLRIADD